MKTRVITALVLALLASLPTLLMGQVFIGAPGLGAEGNTYAEAPLSLHSLGIPSLRYQQVYDALEFSSDMPNGGYITQILFRTDAILGYGFSSTLPEVQIDMAVTPRGSDQLSAVFDDNIGGSLSVVYPRGPLHVAGIPGFGTTAINFSTPYFYNPASGNLLLQIRNFQRITSIPNQSALPAPLDAQNITGDTVSRLFAYDVNASSGTTDSIGLTTFFVVTAVPEPSTVVLSLIGICLLYCWRLRKKRGLQAAAAK